MTQIAGADPFSAAIAARITAGLEAAFVQLAAGVMGQYCNPLGAGPLAFASLPNCFALSLFNQAGPVQQPWTATLGPNGRGSIELGDGYTLHLNEHQSEIVIHNANTNETTRIWGDPHVDFNGKRIFDFWGTTTFTLGNGTKITIETEQWRGNPNEYVASKVIITRGAQGLVVDGISQNKLGDLSITTGHNGYALDARHRDGFTLHENMAGAGWLTERGNVATQRDLDATRVGREYGPGSTAPSLAEFSEGLGQWLAFGSLMWLMSRPVIDFAPPERSERNGR